MDSQRLFSVTYMFGEANLNRLRTYRLRTPKNVEMIVSLMYNFRGLSEKFPTIFTFYVPG